MPGKSEIHQVELIIDLLGTPTEAIWPVSYFLSRIKLYHRRHHHLVVLCCTVYYMDNMGCILFQNPTNLDRSRWI